MTMSPKLIFNRFLSTIRFIFLIVIFTSNSIQYACSTRLNKESISPSSPLQRNQRQLHSTGKLITSLVGPALLSNSNIQRAFASSTPDANKVSSSSSSVSSSDAWAKQVDITDVLFIRHAQSFNNVLYDNLREKYGDTAPNAFLRQERRKLRQSDCGLSTRGVEQANKLQMFAQKGGLTRVLKPDSAQSLDDYLFVSSPMQRCLLTSQALSAGLQKPVYVHPSLYESGGCYRVADDGSTIGLSGSTSHEIESTFPRFKCFPGMERGWYHGKTSAAVESHKEFKARAQSIVDWIWAVHETPPEKRQLHGVPFRHLVFVIHGNLLNAVISGLQGGQGLITHSNTGFSRVELLTGRKNKRVAVVKYLNRLDHIHPDTDSDLMTGNDTVGDSWIQEFQRDD